MGHLPDSRERSADAGRQRLRALGPAVAGKCKPSGLREHGREWNRFVRQSLCRHLLSARIIERKPDTHTDTYSNSNADANAYSVTQSDTYSKSKANAY